MSEVRAIGVSAPLKAMQKAMGAYVLLDRTELQGSRTAQWNGKSTCQ